MYCYRRTGATSIQIFCIRELHLRSMHSSNLFYRLCGSWKTTFHLSSISEAMCHVRTASDSSFRHHVHLNLRYYLVIRVFQRTPTTKHKRLPHKKALREIINESQRMDLYCHRVHAHALMMRFSVERLSCEWQAAQKRNKRIGRHSTGFNTFFSSFSIVDLRIFVAFVTFANWLMQLNTVFDKHFGCKWCH